MAASRLINPNAVPKSANRKALYENPPINNITRLCGAYHERQPYGASRGILCLCCLGQIGVACFTDRA